MSLTASSVSRHVLGGQLGPANDAQVQRQRLQTQVVYKREWSTHFARPADAKQKARRAVCSAAISSLFIYLFIYFLTIPFRRIISTSSAPILATFSGLVGSVRQSDVDLEFDLTLWLWMINLKPVFRSLKGPCHGNQFLVLSMHITDFGDIRQAALARGKSSSAWVSLDADGQWRSDHGTSVTIGHILCSA